jgi:ABC-type Fe3+ transport system permease subunit
MDLLQATIAMSEPTVKLGTAATSLQARRKPHSGWTRGVWRKVALAIFLVGAAWLVWGLTLYVVVYCITGRYGRGVQQDRGGSAHLDGARGEDPSRQTGLAESGQVSHF